MPAFADRLTDAEIAAVASHERTSWGNDYGDLTAQQVADLRQGEEQGGGGDEAAGDADAEPGEDEGEGPAADPPGNDAPAVAGDGERADDGAPLLARGAGVYAWRCAGCHGAEGGGGIGLALASNPRLGDDAWLIRRVLLGANAMPAFASQLSADDIAAVTSFIRSRWGNDYGPVAAERVVDLAVALPSTELGRAADGAGLDDASLGEQRFVQLCSACHGLQGGGDVGPPLAGNPNLEDLQLVIPTILYGRGLMPAFSLHSNREVAAIAEYVRTSWSNAYGTVVPAQVQEYRPESNDRADPPSPDP